MELKNVHQHLQTVLEPLRSVTGRPKAALLTPTDMNSLSRMHSLIRQIPIFSKLGNRFNSSRLHHIQQVNKSVSMNRPLQIMADDFRHCLRAFQTRIRELEDYFVGLWTTAAIQAMDPAEFALKVLNFLVPVTCLRAIVRNTEFHHYNIDPQAHQPTHSEEVFRMFEELHSDRHDSFHFHTVDEGFQRLVGNRLKLDAQVAHSSVFLQVNQTASTLESSAIFILSCDPAKSSTVMHIYQNPKLATLIRKVMDTVFAVMHGHTSGSLTPAKMRNKCQRLLNLFILNSIQIMQTQLAQTPGSSFDFVPRDLQLQAKLGTCGARLTVPLPSFEFDVSFRRFDRKTLSLPERDELTRKIEACLTEFKSDLELKIARSLKEQIFGRKMAFFELDSELRVTGLEMDMAEPNPFLPHLSFYKPGMPLADLITDQTIIERVVQSFEENMERIDAPAYHSFLFGTFKLTIGFLNILEAHLASRGPTFFMLVGLAPQDANRICFDLTAVDEGEDRLENGSCEEQK